MTVTVEQSLLQSVLYRESLFGLRLGNKLQLWSEKNSAKKNIRSLSNIGTKFFLAITTALACHNYIEYGRAKMC